jgi:hypothetical protein
VNFFQLSFSNYERDLRLSPATTTTSTSSMASDYWNPVGDSHSGKMIIPPGSSVERSSQLQQPPASPSSESGMKLLIPVFLNYFIFTRSILLLFLLPLFSTVYMEFQAFTFFISFIPFITSSFALYPFILTLPCEFQLVISSILQIFLILSDEQLNTRTLSLIMKNMVLYRCGCGF